MTAPAAPSPFGAGAVAPAPPQAYQAPAAPVAAAPAPPAPAPAAPVFQAPVAPPAAPVAAPAAAPAPPAPAAAPAAPVAATPFQAPAAPPAPAPVAATPDLSFGAGDPFSAPSGISGEKITQFEGELICVRPTEVIPEMKTSRGVAKGVIRGNTAVLSGPRAGEIIKDMLVFQTALKRELTTILSDPAKVAVLGRLGKSRDKNDGNDPAWIFLPYSDQDYAYAKHWQVQNPAFFA